MYLDIKQNIFDFRLLPGDRFTENEIATRLHVSRTPVREALYRLEREGYLQVQFRSGWNVRELDFRQFDATYQEHAQILRAILQQRADRAIDLLRNHIETSKTEVKKISLHKLYSARRR